MNQLPAKEMLEESVKSMAEMCGGFYISLIKQKVPGDAALAITLAWVETTMSNAHRTLNDN